MTHDEAIDCHDLIPLRVAERELRGHGCRVIATYTDAPFGGDPSRITVTNDFDPPEEIPCTPAAILAFLGY